LRSKESDPEKGALQRGLRFLGYRPRSEAEVQNYLVQQGYSIAVAEKTLEKLRALNYVNDEKFARNWARFRSESRSYGPKRIEQELRTKGIGQPLIQEAVGEAFGQAGEAEKAKLLLEKKFKNKKFDDVKILRRAVAFLQRRGYSNKVIGDLLRHPIEDD
jgi:regulatory protein